MAAISDYLESQLLNHIFRGSTFAKPTDIAIALTNAVPKDSDTGSTIDEVSQTEGARNTGYARVSLGAPADSGNGKWSDVGDDTVTTFSVYLDGESFSAEHNIEGVVGSSSSISGYFYPLYLSQSVAQALDDGQDNTIEFTFDKFPSISFYAPASSAQSGVTEDPGYTTYEGNGFIKNLNNISFSEADTNWGTVSGVAILDSSTYGAGNLLMHAPLAFPREIREGDSISFNIRSLEISLK